MGTLKRDVRISITADEETYLKMQTISRDTYAGLQSLIGEHTKMGSIVTRRDARIKDLKEKVNSYQSDQARRRFQVDRRIIFWQRATTATCLVALVLAVLLFRGL